MATDLLATLALALAALAMLALLVDRSARADAWRRIAEERRWNDERRRDPVE